MKNIIAVNIAKIVSLGLKILNLGSGTSMPGIIANKISKRILSELINQTKQDIIAVTGTNGKTTTANFVSAILKEAKRKVASNEKGANMLTGVTTAMIENANSLAKLDVDNTVLEADEAYVQKFADYFTADYLLVTNLFKDQADRYGDVENTAKLIKNGINKFQLNSYVTAHHMDNPQIFTLILNADIPTIQPLATDNTIYFGFENITYSFEHQEISADDVNCHCGKKYNYSKRFYGNVGHYSCECGIKRPETYIYADAEIFVNYSIINLKNKFTNEEFSVKVNMPGVYNAYNALGAITLAIKMGISPDCIINAFKNYKTVFGRAEETIVKGKNVLIQLIKNPVGATEVLQTVCNDKNAKVFIVINNNAGDGRDVSWIWDAKFDLLKTNQKPIIVSGNCCTDMARRLEDAKIPKENIVIEKNLEKALILALKNTLAEEKLYILPCYTALVDLQKILKKHK